jgi:phage shock protein C
MSESSNGNDNGRPSPNRIYRDTSHSVLTGVCAGVADYFGTSRAAVRIATVVLGLFFPLHVVLAYVIASFLIKPRPQDLYSGPAEEKFWRSVRKSPSETFARAKHKFMSLEQRLRRMEAYVTSSEFELEREINKVRK